MNSVELNLAADIDNLKSILLAKIIRDKIRSDKYIRDSEHRFDLFNDDIPSWNQTADQARKAEEFIVNLEAKLDKLCPIRGGQAPGHSLVSSLEAESAVSENRVEVVEECLRIVRIVGASRAFVFFCNFAIASSTFTPTAA